MTSTRALGTCFCSLFLIWVHSSCLFLLFLTACGLIINIGRNYNNFMEQDLYGFQNGLILIYASLNSILIDFKKKRFQLTYNYTRVYLKVT